VELKLKPEEIRNDLVKKVEELAGVNVFACYQCGKCSSGCPSVPYMEILPNQVLRLLQFGKVERILRTNTHWVCASCFVCSTNSMPSSFATAMADISKFFAVDFSVHPG